MVKIHYCLVVRFCEVRAFMLNKTNQTNQLMFIDLLKYCHFNLLPRDADMFDNIFVRENISFIYFSFRRTVFLQ